MGNVLKSAIALGLSVGLLAASVGSTGAVDFREVGSTHAQVTFIDVDSVKVRAGDLTAWFMIDYVKSETPGELSNKYLSRIDCKSGISGLVSFSTYRNAGGRSELLLSDTRQPHEVEKTPMIRDTISHRLPEAACSIHRTRTMPNFSIPRS